MENTTFLVASMTDRRHAHDLSNSLMAISGLVHVEVDMIAHTVCIDYDGSYVNRAMLQRCIEGSGYPVTDGDAA